MLWAPGPNITPSPNPCYGPRKYIVATFKQVSPLRIHPKDTPFGGVPLQNHKQSLYYTSFNQAYKDGLYAFHHRQNLQGKYRQALDQASPDADAGWLDRARAGVQYGMKYKELVTQQDNDREKRKAWREEEEVRQQAMRLRIAVRSRARKTALNRDRTITVGRDAMTFPRTNAPQGRAKAKAFDEVFQQVGVLLPDSPVDDRTDPRLNIRRATGEEDAASRKASQASVQASMEDADDEDNSEDTRTETGLSGLEEYRHEEWNSEGKDQDAQSDIKDKEGDLDGEEDENAESADSGADAQRDGKAEQDQGDQDDAQDDDDDSGSELSDPPSSDEDREGALKRIAERPAPKPLPKPKECKTQ